MDSFTDLVEAESSERQYWKQYVQFQLDVR